jgi:hypothetical protein
MVDEPVDSKIARRRIEPAPNSELELPAETRPFRQRHRRGLIILGLVVIIVSIGLTALSIPFGVVPVFRIVALVIFCLLAVMVMIAMFVSGV